MLLYYVSRNKRKIIETLFSLLCDQFMIRRNYAKTFKGFKTRIIFKIIALTAITVYKQVYLTEILITLKLTVFKMHNGLI